jgi:hypothetical protein
MRDPVARDSTVCGCSCTRSFRRSKLVQRQKQQRQELAMQHWSYCKLHVRYYKEECSYDMPWDLCAGSSCSSQSDSCPQASSVYDFIGSTPRSTPQWLDVLGLTVHVYVHTCLPTYCTDWYTWRSSIPPCYHICTLSYFICAAYFHTFRITLLTCLHSITSLHTFRLACVHIYLCI